jgi:hypothetical protein
MDLCDYMDEYKRQLKKGIIQQAYRGLMDYIMGLRTHFEKQFPDLMVSGSVYHGYMDMTYFALFPQVLKDRKLKIAIVFNYDSFRFEVWLSGCNKQVQSKYWKLFKESKWCKYHIIPTIDGADSIVEHILVENPDFSDTDFLTKQIEKATIQFITDIADFLSAC